MKVLLAVLILLFIFFLEELYRYVFCRNSSKLFIYLFDKNNGHEKAYYVARDQAARKLGALPHEELTMENARGQKLKGYYYPCGSNGKKIVFVIHGYRSNHLETTGLLYDYYHSRGIDIFCCDHTAIGESEGHFIGFDVLETPDCLQWIECLKEKFGSDTQIFLHGFSMGGGTVLQMSSSCPEQVKFIISDSGFPNARFSMAHMVGPFYTPLRLINRVVAGYDWNDSDVTDSLSKSKIPILFVHGRDDKLVPYSAGPRLYDSYGGEKDCLFPENTRHIETIYTNPEAYAEKIDSFLQKYIK